MANTTYKNVSGFTNAEKIAEIAKVNGKMIHVAWKKDMTSKMRASAKKAGITITKVTSTAVTTDKEYLNTVVADHHERTGSAWQVRYQCEAKGIVAHKTTGKLYMQAYVPKSKDGQILNPIRSQYYLNGEPVSKEEVEPYLTKSSSGELEMMTIALDDIFELGKED